MASDVSTFIQATNQLVIKRPRKDFFSFKKFCRFFCFKYKKFQNCASALAFCYFGLTSAYNRIMSEAAVSHIPLLKAVCGNHGGLVSCPWPARGNNKIACALSLPATLKFSINSQLLERRKQMRNERFFFVNSVPSHTIEFVKAQSLPRKFLELCQAFCSCIQLLKSWTAVFLLDWENAQPLSSFSTPIEATSHECFASLKYRL